MAKLIIALSMTLFGNNEYGFRIPSVVFGTLAILVLYLLMKKVSGDRLLSLMTCFLFSFDNLVFVHSRIATLDISLLFFLILGVYLYSCGRFVLSGISLAAGTLCKIGGLYGLLAVATYHVASGVLRVDGELDWATRAKRLEALIISYGVAFFAMLFVMDRIWGGYLNPIDHLLHILSYTKALTAPVPTGIQSNPWQWLLNQVQIPYLKVDVNKMADGQVTGSYTTVHFNGAMNPLIVYLTLPSVIYATYLLITRRDRTSLLSVAWFAGTYLPFIPMVLIWNRVMYLFYFLNTLPSACAAISLMALDQKPPKIVLGIYLIGVIVMFALMFPFKAIP